MLNSVGNALRVLEHLVERGESGVSEMARDLDLSPGGVHRIVSTLVEARFAEQNRDNRKYLPGSRILELANAMRSQVEFLDLAHGHLERLMQRTQETVNFGVLRGDEVVYVDRVVSNQPLAVEVKIGSRVPAYCTALGKALLAHAEPTARDSYLNRLKDLGQGDGPSVPTREHLEEDLSRIRVRGTADDPGEFSPDIACVAAPIFNGRDRAVAAVSISGPASRMRARRDLLEPMVEIAAKEISLLLKELGEDSPRL